MNYVSEKLLKEKTKRIFLIGKFVAELLKYENATDTANFLGQI